MEKSKEELQAEKEKSQLRLVQEQHKLQRLENRKKYAEKGERQKRTHRLCNLGGIVESIAPAVKDLTRTEISDMKLSAEISELEKAIAKYESSVKDADRFISLIDKYENFDNLNITMLNEFVEKIYVHKRARKGSTETTQEVEIHFNFIGQFIPPTFKEPELTPEEQEALRKREARKDRLHQNYLRRKERGKVQAYDEKHKDERKARIEAKKAAIRAEDIANGVFIPVMDLPKLTPVKAQI